MIYDINCYIWHYNSQMREKVLILDMPIPAAYVMVYGGICKYLNQMSISILCVGSRVTYDYDIAPD